MNTGKLAAFIIGIFCFFPALCLGSNLKGKVVSVSDGETFSISDNDENLIGLRLYGIKVPKNGQDFYEEAKEILSVMIKGKVVDFRIVKKDEYGQSVAFVYLNGACINGAMIKAGYAVVDEAKCKDEICGTWKDYQNFASQTEKGLWKQTKNILAGDRGKGNSATSIDVKGPEKDDHQTNSSNGSNSNNNGGMGLGVRSRNGSRFYFDF
jgi:micrococcal nuclease